ncbi:MFS transporter [Aestuariicella hydrocarbonica]|uniref:MFS transporter n=1 Tax=Pseudomaricurvus hydrocarbonicus TaxID=1470433 RepID=A0A9E5MMB2_9GAMM|nr:MFS transporter [Aestuariicella hydrocarbonica]NHO66803.1 MFS transporter [Aestuariicella hydrocarbonica]
MNYSVLIPYLMARACMSLTNTMLSVAIGWHLYKLTGNPFDLAMVGLVQIIPMLLLFMVTGWVVDHFSRKRILVICALLETLILLFLASAMHTQDFDKYTIFTLLFIHGCSRAFFGPAQQAILPNIVSREALAQAVAITSTVWNVASTSGPFIAGLLLAWIDKDTYWVLGGLGFTGTVLFLTLPAISHVQPTARGLAQLLGGIQFIKNNPIVLGSISLDMFAVLAGSVMALLPIYALDILHVGPDALGVLRGMPALGAVMVGLVMAKIPMRNTGPSLFIALVVFALSIVLFAYSTVFWLSLVALWVYGAADMVSVNIRSTLIQIATPDDLRGRVSAVNSIFIATSNKMGDFRAGSVATILSPVATVALGGLMALIVAVGGCYLFPTIRKLDKLDDIDAESRQ